MGTPLDSFFFYTPKKKSVTGLGIFGRSDHFFFSRMKDLMIWSDLTESFLIFVKILMGTKLDSFFFTHKIDQKVASYWLVSVTTHYNCIKWQCIRCLKVYRLTMEISINLNRISVIWNFLDDERTSLRFRVKL